MVDVQDVRQGSLCPDVAHVYGQRCRGGQQAAQLRRLQHRVVLNSETRERWIT